MNKKRFSKALFYGSAVLCSILFIQFGLRLVVINGDSMAGTLRNGDIIAIWQWGVDPNPGDIVVTNKNNPFGVRLTKRVVAISRQHIILKDGVLSVDEEIVASSIAGADFETVVPDGAVFLMGDNYSHSRDSREIGAVPIDDITGTMLFRVWPVFCG